MSTYLFFYMLGSLSVFAYLFMPTPEGYSKRNETIRFWIAMALFPVWFFTMPYMIKTIG